MTSKARPRADQIAPLSDQLRRAVEEWGGSLTELARLSGVDSGTLSRFMRAERSITLALADRIGEALKLRIVRGGRR